MPCDPADRGAKVHALRHRLAGCDAHGGETDVVGVFQGGYAAATVEGDVEFARQSVELAVVEDRVIQSEAERPRVVELERIDAGGRVPGDVSDIVRARAARSETSLGELLQHSQRVFRRDLADLQIGSRGNVRIAGAVLIGDLGVRAQFVRRYDAVRIPQPQHERVLRWRD